MSTAYLSSSSNNNQYLRPPNKLTVTGAGTSSTGGENASECNHQKSNDHSSQMGGNSSGNTPTGSVSISDSFGGNGHSPMDMISPVTPISPITPMTPTFGSSSSVAYNEVSPAITPVPPKDLDKFLDAIIIDIRCFNHFSTNHLQNSINLCIPSTLLKRKSYKLPQILSSNSMDANIKDCILSQDCKLLFVDNNSSRQLSANLYFTINKFLAYNPNYSIYYLLNGFDNLPSNTMNNKSLMVSDCKNPGSFECMDSNNVLSGFKLPSSAPANQKFIASVKKNALPKLDIKSIVSQSRAFPLGNNSTHGSNCQYSRGNVDNFDSDLDSYHYAIKVPPFTTKQLTNLPLWLKHIITKNNTLEINSNAAMLQYLNSRFTKLEKSERIRLNLAIEENGHKDKGQATRLIPELQTEHSSICSPNSPCPSCDNIVYKIPRGIEYGFKNRYNNIWPYEHSRVRLINSPYEKPKSPSKQQPSDQFVTDDDYFNANYIHFPQLSDYKYIATQNPLKSTIKDFWNIVYNNKINLIICLNQQYQLSDNYFDDQCIGNYSISVVKMTAFENYKLRLIKLQKFSDEFFIYHLEFTEWPDFGVPNINSLLDFIKFKNRLIEEHDLNNYTLVHCSAGCGRTGCFIAIDLIIDSFKVYYKHIESNPGLYSSSNKLNPYDMTDLVYKSIQFQRQQRISMCQNFDQYIVCYETLLQYLQNTL